MRATLSERQLTQLADKEYRDAYVAEHVRTGIAFQIRALREQRDLMSQAELGRRMGKPQSVVSRLEDPDYGKLTLQTLFEVASAFDVALVVQFANYPEFIARTRNVSPQALAVTSFSPSQFVVSSVPTSPKAETPSVCQGVPDLIGEYSSSVPIHLAIQSQRTGTIKYWQPVGTHKPAQSKKQPLHHLSQYAYHPE